MSSRDSLRVFPPKTSPMKKAPHKALITPSIHVATDLPCPEDRDLDDIPRPKYTPSDISRVQSILLHFVPVELADAIIDMAEYWPWVAVSRNSFTSAYSALEAPDSNAQWCYIVSPKIPSIERAGVCVPTVVKMVKFFIKTYESCYGKTKESKATDATQGYTTWFESLILRNGESIPSYEDSSRPNDWYSNLAAPHPKFLNDFREPELPGAPVANPLDERTRWHVATNSPSCGVDKSKAWHEVTWKHNDTQTQTAAQTDPSTGMGTGSGFIDSLSVDDQIVLMARAMSPGWISAVFNVKIEIYYAFSSSYL